MTISRIAKQMQEVLQKKAKQLADATGFTQRHREVSGSSFIVGLMSGWQANPQASLSGLSQAIGNAGTPLTRQALAKRFDQSAVVFCHEMLRESLEVVVKAMPVNGNLLDRFTAVELVDSSIITLPNSLQSVWQGFGGFGEKARRASLKLNVCWDLLTGQLTTLDLSDGTHHDRHSQAWQHPVQAGSLRIADLGYFKLDDLEQIAQQDGYYLIRYKLGTYVYQQVDSPPVNLAQWLPQPIGKTLDGDIYLGKDKQLPCRLVAQRVPKAVVKQRRKRIREEARQDQQPVSPAALTMAQWTIYITNVPADMLTIEEVFVLGRYRWQIELLFKLWKSDLGIDQWRTQNPYRILCEIYIKLIGAVVTNWLLLTACWHNPRRSLRQAIPTIRGLAWQFANSLSCHRLLCHALDSMCRALSCCRMDCSQQHPRAFQLLEGTICLS